MKTLIYIFLFLLIHSVGYCQITRLDSVEILMKENYLKYYTENISKSEYIIKRNERLNHIKNCNFIYEVDTINSNYFEDYDLILLKKYGAEFDCNGTKFNVGLIRDGCDAFTNDFLIGVPKVGSLSNVIFFSGNFYCSDLFQFPPLKNDSNLINDSNFVEEVKRLKFDIGASNFISKIKKIGRIEDFEIYELEKDEENEYNKERKIYFDLKKFIFIDFEQYQKLSNENRK